MTQESCTNNNHSQQFKFKDSTYGNWTRIESRANSNCLDISGGGNNWGAELIHWACHTGDNQRFKTFKYSYANLSESIYGIQVNHSQLWLDIPGGNKNVGVQPIQYPAYFTNYNYLTPSYDRFSVMGYENGAIRPSSFILQDGDIAGARSIYGNSGKKKIEEYIMAKHSGRCLEFNIASKKSTQELCNTAENNQKFRIIFLDAEYFRIFDPDTQQCLVERNYKLALENCGQENESSVNNQQRFRFLDGEFTVWSRIQSKSSSQCLDVAWADMVSGAEIALWHCHNDDNQKFKVLKQLPGKICEFNDPIHGTTSGCTESSVGGYDGTVVFLIRKNGNPLLHIEKSSTPCTVKISGTNNNYTVSGDCNNYRVYYE